MARIRVGTLRDALPPVSSGGPSRSGGPVSLRPGAKGLVRDADRVLLVCERRADGSTFWSLPGGGCEPGEAPRAALARELREELRADPVVGHPVGTVVYPHSNRIRTVSVYTVYDVELETAPVPNGEEGIRDCQWVDPSDPPAGLLAPFDRALGELHR